MGSMFSLMLSLSLIYNLGCYFCAFTSLRYVGPLILNLRPPFWVGSGSLIKFGRVSSFPPPLQCKAQGLGHCQNEALN